MRTVYLLNGKKIDLNSPRTIGEVTYPHLRDSWQELGIVETPREDYPDPTWNKWTENEDGTLNITPLPLAKCKEIKKQAVAAERYTREVAGVVLPNGAKIATDRESQAQLNSAYTSLKAGFIQSTPWKAENGWSLITLVEVEPVATAVASHVRDCFTWEKEQSDLIDALTTREEVINFVVETLPVEVLPA